MKKYLENEDAFIEYKYEPSVVPENTKEGDEIEHKAVVRYVIFLVPIYRENEEPTFKKVYINVENIIEIAKQIDNINQTRLILPFDSLPF